MNPKPNVGMSLLDFSLSDAKAILKYYLIYQLGWFSWFVSSVALLTVGYSSGHPLPDNHSKWESGIVFEFNRHIIYQNKENLKSESNPLGSLVMSSAVGEASCQ